MKRRLAREIAVQSLYQMEMNEVSASDAVDMLMDEASNEESEIGAKASDVDRIDEHVRGLVYGVTEHKVAIDEMLQHYLTGWQVDRLSRVDRRFSVCRVMSLYFVTTCRLKRRLTKRLKSPNILVPKNRENSLTVSWASCFKHWMRLSLKA